MMFNKVYEIAKNAQTLEDLKSSVAGLYIDETKGGVQFITVAGQLAMDGEIEKVEWMRQLGASVNDIAYAFALANNHAQVTEYLFKYQADTTAIACGYALAGNHQYVEQYRQQLGANVDDIACAFALANNHAQVNVYLTQYDADIYAIIRGYAHAGNHEQVEAYRTQYGVSDNDIFHAYIEAQNYEKAKAYNTSMSEFSVDSSSSASPPSSPLVRSMSFPPSPNPADMPLNIEHEMKCQQTPHENGKKHDLNCLLDSYLKERSNVVDSTGKTEEYLYSSFFSFFQNSYTQEAQAVFALKKVLNGEHANLSKHLSTLRSGCLGEKLREFIKSGQANDIVNKPVNTVRDFIQTLETGVSHRNYL